MPKKIKGILNCFDSIIITGTLPGFYFAQGVTSYFYSHRIRIFDYYKFSEFLRDQIRENAKRIADEHGINIEFNHNDNLRKEKRIKQIIKKRAIIQDWYIFFLLWKPAMLINPGMIKYSTRHI